MTNVIEFPRKTNVLESFNYLFKTLPKTELSNTKCRTINFFNISISKEYNVDLARLIYEYNCELIGLSQERLEIINSIINTGYFIKENKTPKEYYLIFRRLLELSDFSLMILDNTYYNILHRKKEIPFSIIQPLYFENNYFYYQKLKAGMVQPKELEKQIQKGTDIWEVSNVHIYNLIEFSSGFRFATTKLERDYLELYSDILSQRLTGFY